MLNYMGAPKTSGSNFTQKFPNNKFTFIHKHSDAVASEVGAGGTIEWKSGSIDLTSGQQNYDLQSLWAAVSESNKRIAIKDIYHFRPGSATARASAYGSDYTLGGNEMIKNIGGGYTQTNQAMYYMYPVFEDVLRAEHIEISDTIRKSQYSYELINNKIKLFPTPASATKLWFRYTVEDFDPFTDGDTSSGSAADDLISDISNVPYEYMVYNSINSMGKNWIKKYSLALAKELLGNIRRKFESLPIPNESINLDGDQLISDAHEMKVELKEELMDLLEKTNLETMVERDKNIQENMTQQLEQFPLLPFIG
jgi:hypothetical protein